ncbi:MAG: signal peptidase I [Solirubrobacteraceae bacterium]|jgi:signal peptidase I
MRRHPFKKLLAIALGLIVLGCVWFYFAPIPLGGSTSYVVTHGISMEPRFHTGDLAIVRSQPTYHVGEIVAYHNKMLHVVALHRIIGREGERYIFKGDNNDFIDSEHPRASQLIGALWIHIRGGGSFLQSFSSPARAGLLIAIGMLILTGGVFARRRRRGRRDRRTGNATPRALPSLPPLSPSAPAVAVLAIGILLLLPFLVLALLAFTRAPSTRHTVQIPYTQSGTLSYSADTSPNPAYPDGVATVSEPLFTRLVNDVNLRFDYAFETKASHSLAGRGSFLLLVAASDGWHRTLPLGSPTFFKGDHATITATLSLSSMAALARSVETATGIEGSYGFTIVPSVIASGKVESLPLHATFSPAVQFSVRGDQVELQGSESTVSSETKLLTGGGAAGPLPAALRPRVSGSASGSQIEPRTLALGPWHVSVSTARTLALSAIGVILTALLAALALIQPILALIAPRRRDEKASILARYGGLIIPVAHITPLRGVPVIDVADMNALARIAEHYDRSILHETTVAGDAFWVADESGQFRYTIGAPVASANDRSAAAAPSTNGQVAASNAAAAPPTNGQVAASASPANDQVAVPASTASEQVVAPAWSGNDQAVPAWTQTGQLVAPAAAENGDDPTLVWTTENEQIAAAEWPETGAVPSPAWLESGELTAPAGFENGHTPAPACVENSDIAAPTWSDMGEVTAPAAAPEWSENGQVPAPAAAPAWSDVGQIPTPEWSETGQVSAPGWEQSRETVPSEPTTDNGWVPAAQNGWGTHNAEPDTFAREGAGWRESPADPSLAPAGAAVTYFTGLEWTTNS